jgi:hypothetical protein
MNRILLVLALLNWNCASLLTVPIHSIIDDHGKLHKYIQELPQNKNLTTVKYCKIHSKYEQLTIKQTEKVVIYSIK